ncbi:hypothetical protein ACP4OV_011916 [Aristida adscensionis]
MAAASVSVSVAAALLLLLLLAAAPPPSTAADDATTHLHFFMHDTVSGSGATAVQVIKGPGAAAAGMAFGDTMVIDDPLTATSSPTSAAVGRAQGIYMMASQSGAALMVCANLLLTSGDYNGSTIAVMGRDDTAADVRELAVVGGTGKFRMATGYVLWKTASMNGPDGVMELDVYLTTGNGTATIDAGAPVSPVGGGGGGGAAAGGSPAKSGAAGRALGWANAAAAVVAAVLGIAGVWW